MPNIGDRVIITDTGYTYTDYDSWVGINHVPGFVKRSSPTHRKVYTITHFDRHSIGVPRMLYVLDSEFIVDARAFELIAEDKTIAQQHSWPISTVEQRGNKFYDMHYRMYSKAVRMDEFRV